MRVVGGWVRGRLAGHSERGSVVVEFLAVTVVLIVPLVYLVLTLGRIQSAIFAAEAASRDVGRIVSVRGDDPGAMWQASRTVELAFADHGIDVDGREVLVMRCGADPCRTPGGRIYVEVSTTVRLPWVPEAAAAVVPLEVPVSATHTATVPRFAEVSPAESP